MRIDGHTKVLAHLGVPTESFKAPLIYNPWFAAKGIKCVVVPMGCEAEDFPMFLPRVARLRNFAGALITMPHKMTVVDLLDEVSTAVQICGACNAVKRDGNGRLIGDMFDGAGFVRGVQTRGREVKGTGALIVGSGGVGSAIACSFAEAGIGRLGLFDADEERAEKLRGRLMQHFPQLEIVTGDNDPAGWDIVVNATPLGMQDGDPLPMDASRIDPGALVGEVVMKAEETPLLAAARARGCETQVGTDMLFEQIPAYLEFFGFGEATASELRSLAQITY